jgi:hypothetical protein
MNLQAKVWKTPQEHFLIVRIFIRAGSNPLKAPAIELGLELTREFR